MTVVLALLGSTALWGAIATLLAWRGKLRLRELELRDAADAREHAVEQKREDSQQIITMGAFEALRDENEALRSNIQKIWAENLTLRQEVRRLRSEPPPPSHSERDTEPEPHK